jgi:hypothetical protein
MLTQLTHFFPLFLIAGLTFYSLRARGEMRRSWLVITLPALLCGLGDLLLLALLPSLGISFGAPEKPLALFNIARLLLVLPALGLLISFGGRKRLSPVVSILSGLIQAGLLCLAFYGLYVEPFALGVTRLPVPAPAFLPDRPLRILQISDLHVEHPTRREQELPARVAELQPDLIVLTGDYLNPSYRDDPDSLQETRALQAELHAPYGVYAVNGTVDGPANMAILFDGLEDVTVLDDDFVLVPVPGGTLAVAGIRVTQDWERDTRALAALMEEVPPGAYTLLLYHSPDLIEAASASGVDLYLAGHTHGGQIRLPIYGAIITFSIYDKQYEMGEYHVGATTLYVSRGVGMEGWDAPRMRFLCPPELVLVELEP